ncbi:zinc transporter [Clostridia bacterium]|nr:zinc transporter [Clostridia bacterium]
MYTFLGILIPFAGTTLGAALVIFLRRETGAALHKIQIGFASGVMIAASIWSLLLPAIEQAKSNGGIAWLPAAAGFLSGAGFLIAIDCVIPRLYKRAENAGVYIISKKNAMMTLAITLHNIPEGMAVGAVFAGMLAGTDGITLSSALALSIGIAIQNFPEGAIVSMPLVNAGISKGKAFLYGTLSGAVEPAAAAATILLTSALTPVLPFLLSFAAGAMIYVVIQELIPELHEGGRSKAGAVSAAVGFVMMMVLDVAL